MHPISTKPHIFFGCHLTSNRTPLQYQVWHHTSHKVHFWFSQKKKYVESNSLSIKKALTIGYLTKLHSWLTNCTNHSQAPSHEKPQWYYHGPHSSQWAQTLAQTKPSQCNGKQQCFCPWNTMLWTLSNTNQLWCNQTQITTDVIGIKCVVDKAHLLKELLFSQFATPWNSCIYVFVPQELCTCLDLMPIWIKNSLINTFSIVLHTLRSAIGQGNWCRWYRMTGLLCEDPWS